MNRFSNKVVRFLTVAVALLFALVAQPGQTQAQVNLNIFLSGNGPGPVTGTAYANTTYAFGHIDSMVMQISGPNGPDTHEYLCTATGSTGCPGFVSESLNSNFEYDTIYTLTVFACASDDNGQSCAYDQVSFRTPPQSGGTEFPPGTGCLFWFDPCPTITSISPQPIHLGIGTFTVYGSGLDVVGWGQIWYKNPWLTEYHWTVEAIEVAEDHVTFLYDFNPTGYFYPCWNAQICGGFSLHVYGQQGDHYWVPIQVSP